MIKSRPELSLKLELKDERRRGTSNKTRKLDDVYRFRLCLGSGYNWFWAVVLWDVEFSFETEHDFLFFFGHTTILRPAISVEHALQDFGTAFQLNAVLSAHNASCL